MQSKISLERFLDQTATRGTWYGGGSAAALACALAAALLEKLASRPTTIGSIRTVRTTCARLIHQDATAFARVIEAQARRDHHAVQQALKTAIDIPWQVYACSRRLLRASFPIRQTISPRFRSDLRCAVALAKASGEAARVLVMTNLAWLGDGAYSRRVYSRLRRETRRIAAWRLRRSTRKQFARL